MLSGCKAFRGVLGYLIEPADAFRGVAVILSSSICSKTECLGGMFCSGEAGYDLLEAKVFEGRRAGVFAEDRDEDDESLNCDKDIVGRCEGRRPVGEFGAVGTSVTSLSFDCSCSLSEGHVQVGFSALT